MADLIIHRADFTRLREGYRVSELNRARLEAECAQISAEFGLPPTMRPAEGEILRMRSDLVRLRAEVEQLRSDAQAGKHLTPALLDSVSEGDLRILYAWSRARQADAVRLREALRDLCGSCVSQNSPAASEAFARAHALLEGEV